MKPSLLLLVNSIWVLESYFIQTLYKLLFRWGYLRALVAEIDWHNTDCSHDLHVDGIMKERLIEKLSQLLQILVILRFWLNIVLMCDWHHWKLGNDCVLSADGAAALISFDIQPFSAYCSLKTVGPVCYSMPYVLSTYLDVFSRNFLWFLVIFCMSVFSNTCFHAGSCPCQSYGLSLAAMRRLLRLRLDLAQFCLAILEEHCAEEKRQVLAQERKTTMEIALEEFVRCTPEPNSLEQVGHFTSASKWVQCEIVCLLRYNQIYLSQ